jgi:ABC-type amino acid transport substrate-binding protein
MKKISVIILNILISIVSIAMSIILLMAMSITSIGQDTLNVGVHVTAPFVEKTDVGYDGVSIKLLNEYVKDTNVVVNYTEYGTTIDLMNSIKSGEQDLGVGAITITHERYQDVNFTQPYYRSSISLAYDPDEAYGTWDAIVSFFTIDLLYGILMLYVFLWVAGMIFWLVEKNDNDSFKNGGMLEGVYFAFMILSTVGFGDVSPVTKVGKILVMFFGTICLIVSGFFIGNISSSFALNKMDSEITVENLNKKKIGTIRDCTSSDFLDNNSVRYIGFESAEEGLQAVETGELDVFVYDTPILQNMIEVKNLSDAVVLSDQVYEPQFYGFPISKCCNIDDVINPIIVKYTNSSEWKNVLYQYKLEQ